MISIAKKTTGGLYIDGKDSYTTILDVVLSIFVLIIISVTFITGFNQLNEIVSFQVSSITNYNDFFGTNSTSIMKFLSDKNTTNNIEAPEYLGQQ